MKRRLLTRVSLTSFLLTRGSLTPFFLTRGSLTSFARASKWGGLAATLVAAILAPAPAIACAVCAGGNPANRFAFFMMTIVMSLLPLTLFTVAFLWLRSRIRARGGSEFVERDAQEPARRPALIEPPERDAGALHSPPTPAS